MNRPWERHCIECGLRCAEPCWRCAIRAAVGAGLSRRRRAEFLRAFYGFDAP